MVEPEICNLLIGVRFTMMAPDCVKEACVAFDLTRDKQSLVFFILCKGVDVLR